MLCVDCCPSVGHRLVDPAAGLLAGRPLSPVAPPRSPGQANHATGLRAHATGAAVHLRQRHWISGCPQKDCSSR
eukprot:10148325-Karenia_brevis.AAC.1